MTPVIPAITDEVEDLNKLAQEVAKMVPVVGGAIAAVVALFRKRKQTPPPTFLEALSEYDPTLAKLIANDAEYWSGRETGDEKPVDDKPVDA